MTEKERAYERKRNIVNAMCYTAAANGKNDNYYHMQAVAERLHRMETTLSRLAETECCRELHRYEQEKQESLSRLACKVISEEIGCRCYINGDPRGYILRLYLIDADGRKWFNTWDGETTGLAW